MVLSNLLVPGLPATLDNSRARAVGVGRWGCLYYFSRLSSLHFFLPLSGRQPDTDQNTV